MLLRYFGYYEEGACFAILLVNAVWPVVEIAFKPTLKKDENFLLDAGATVDKSEKDLKKNKRLKKKNGGAAHE